MIRLFKRDISDMRSDTMDERRNVHENALAEESFELPPQRTLHRGELQGEEIGRTDVRQLLVGARTDQSREDRTDTAAGNDLGKHTDLQQRLHHTEVEHATVSLEQ
jgi:hypothetical protein